MANTRAQKVEFYKIASKIAGGNISKVYYKHGVLYGDYFDLRIYNDVKSTFYATSNIKVKSKQGSKRFDSLARSRVALYRLIVANVGKHGRFKPIFATYTFASNITNLADANLRFKLYLEKLREYLGTRPKYVCVPEVQERGAWHFHVIFFNLPKISFKDNDAMWGQGDSAVNLQVIKGIRDVGAYCAKYLSKEMIASCGINKKLYYSSRFLVRPIDVFHLDAIDTIVNNHTLKVLSVYSGNNYSQIKYKML